MKNVIHISGGFAPDHARKIAYLISPSGRGITYDMGGYSITFPSEEDARDAVQKAQKRYLADYPSEIHQNLNVHFEGNNFSFGAALGYLAGVPAMY